MHTNPTGLETNGAVEEVEIRGHIIDSLILPKVLDEILTRGGSYVLKDIQIGQRRENPSHARIEVRAPTSQVLRDILDSIHDHGAVPAVAQDCHYVPADMAGAFPEDFYSTTNYRTQVRLGAEWVDVEDQEMDCGILVDPEGGAARCIPMAEVCVGDLIVVGRQGLRVFPAETQARHSLFEFMTSAVSSEKPKGVTVREIAAAMKRTREAGEKVLAVLGPAVVHTGSVPHICQLIRGGHLDVLFAGNALATHDIEQALYGTSLGVWLDRGLPAEEGHEHHLRAINTIRRQGGIQAAVDKGVLKSGIMYECIRHSIPFVLAGSIRDDGPLPEVITDVLQAQQQMRELIRGVGFCLMMATALHSIATGNLLPAWVKVACVDINPATVTKLTDRGSTQTIGIVTDAEPFLRALVNELGNEEPPVRQRRILMCPPDYYGIEYEINPWMSRSRGSETRLARAQWTALHETLLGLGVEVELLKPQPSLPDLVFTANAGLIFGRRFYSSRFRHEVRACETPHYDAWFAEHDFAVEHLPEGMYFEGAGDALFCGPVLFAGYRIRSDVQAHQHLAGLLGKQVLPLELINPRFYHLDTCFCPLAPGEALYYPAAFDAYGRKVLQGHIPKLLAVSEAEAHRFGCNAVVVGRTVVINSGCEKLAADLRAWGYEPIAVALDEFIKAGGSAKCLTLRLDGEEAAVWDGSAAGGHKRG